MGIYRGPGGTGDAVNDASSEALITIQAKDAAIAAQVAAETARDAAQLAETNAETAETNAAASASAASTSASNASTSATNASNSASAAATSATNASNSASAAATSATNAANSATAAQTAQTAAELAETNAETAETNAETAATNAASSASAASTSASNAASSASAASTSASNAATSATNASNSASAAATSETNAANSASAAATSATNASNSASAAATSATNAANSATLAASYTPSQTGNAGKYLKTDGTNTSWDALDISTSDVTGTLPISNGGTGQTTAQNAMNTFAGAVTSGSYLRGNGTNVVMSTIQTADVPTLNQNTTGSAATLTTARTIQTNLASTSSASFDGSANITPGVTGTLAVGNGGTGATTLAGANIPVTNVANTFTGLQTFAGTSSNADIKTSNIIETVTTSATAATGTINYDITTQSVLYYTSNASGNFTVNFRGSSGTSLNTLMATGESMSVTFMVTNGTTAYYNSAIQVDGNSVIPKWQGGTAPTSGNASSIDVYNYVIIKTGSAAFTVLASQTKFA